MVSSQNLADELRLHLEEASRAFGGDGKPVPPQHRVPFHWPPHPVSKDYHVLPSDWTGKASLDFDGETFDVQVARTAQGVFGRVEKVWNEARGTSLEEVLERLKESAQPYFDRQKAIARALGRNECIVGNFSQLTALDQLKLLFCPDRDVAHDAQLAIESRASSGLYAPSLIAILREDRHPYRRSAQWCVLDMFEDLPSFCPDPESQGQAVQAVKDLIWSSSDDYARTIYKAGVVLGGHVCTDQAAEALLACVQAPSKYGRRSAIHAAFHLAEWMPQFSERIVQTLQTAAEVDPEPVLRDFAKSMARDVLSKAYEHMTEPAFAEER